MKMSAKTWKNTGKLVKNRLSKKNRFFHCQSFHTDFQSESIFEELIKSIKIDSENKENLAFLGIRTIPE